MKKTILVVITLALALGALGVGVAFAQTQQPPAAATPPANGVTQPYGRGGMHQFAGQLHTYQVEALAEKLGLTVEQVNALVDSGKRPHEIALENGVAEADLPAFMQEVHRAALDKAVAAGVLTQEQADQALARMQARFQNGGMDCLNGGARPMDGSGFRGGHGGMGGMGGGGHHGGGFMNQQP
jgi:hypothetical protein